jgi:NAD(P)-dependent dehydrogenase (short-subunit alcohol dehydrogenase family)
MGQLEGKIAIITGASMGIGKGIARAFAKEGAKLVIASRNKENLDSTANQLQALGAHALVVPTDVAEEGQVVDLFKKTVQKFGRLDILVNNAGVFCGGPFEQISLETWQKIININLTGPFLCTREAMKIMKKQRAGRIINIGSISAQMPRLNSSPYTVTKHGLVGLTKSTALEGRAFGIAVSCLHPGNVATEARKSSKEPMDQEPMMTTEDVAMTAVTMAALPNNVNLLEAIVLPVDQLYIGRG